MGKGGGFRLRPGNPLSSPAVPRRAEGQGDQEHPRQDQRPHQQEGTGGPQVRHGPPAVLKILDGVKQQEGQREAGKLGNLASKPVVNTAKTGGSATAARMESPSTSGQKVRYMAKAAKFDTTAPATLTGTVSSTAAYFPAITFPTPTGMVR